MVRRDNARRARHPAAASADRDDSQTDRRCKPDHLAADAAGAVDDERLAAQLVVLLVLPLALRLLIAVQVELLGRAKDEGEHMFGDLDVIRP